MVQVCFLSNILAKMQKWWLQICSCMLLKRISCFYLHALVSCVILSTGIDTCLQNIWSNWHKVGWRLWFGWTRVKLFGNFLANKNKSEGCYHAHNMHAPKTLFMIVRCPSFFSYFQLHDEFLIHANRPELSIFIKVF